MEPIGMCLCEKCGQSVTTANMIIHSYRCRGGDRSSTTSYSYENLNSTDIPLNNWRCPMCTFENRLNTPSCDICGASRASTTRSQPSELNRTLSTQPNVMPSATTIMENTWNCTSCTLTNNVNSRYCEVCGTASEAGSTAHLDGHSARSSIRDAPVVDSNQMSRELSYMRAATALGAIGGASLALFYNRNMVDGAVAGAGVGALSSLVYTVLHQSRPEGSVREFSYDRSEVANSQSSSQSRDRSNQPSVRIQSFGDHNHIIYHEIIQTPVGPQRDRNLRYGTPNVIQRRFRVSGPESRSGNEFIELRSPRRIRESNDVDSISPFGHHFDLGLDDEPATGQYGPRQMYGSVADHEIDEMMRSMFEDLRRNPQGVGGDVNTPRGLSESELQSLPLQPVTTTTQNADPVCNICLENFELGTNMKCLPCCHKYHLGCIDRWLKLSPSCPVCKRSLH